MKTFAAIVTLTAGLAALALWTFSSARTPLGYMVIGTLLTALGLTAAFATILMRSRRTARKIPRSS